MLFVKAIPPSNPFLGLLQKEKKPVRPYLATGGNLIRAPLLYILAKGGERANGDVGFIKGAW